MSVKFVIARYNEDISWTSQIAHPTIIYNKGTPLSNMSNVIELINKGREGETFLRHIIENYNSLDDITVFLQGDPFDHLTILTGWQNELSDNQKPLLFKKINDEITPLSEFATFYQVKYNVPGNTNNSRTHFYCMKYFNEKHNYFTVSPSAQYIVPKKYILSRSLEFWETLHKAIYNDELDGYAMENLWWLAFHHNPDRKMGNHDYEKNLFITSRRWGVHNTPYSYYETIQQPQPQPQPQPKIIRRGMFGFINNLTSRR
jgi:Protein of unknown function (DUF3431)